VTGKALSEQTADIVIRFKPSAHSLYAANNPTELQICLQPKESIQLLMNAKQIGKDDALVTLPLDLHWQDYFKERQASAYERLLQEAICGRQALFVRQDEIEAAWAFVMPILEAMKTMRPSLYRVDSHYQDV
jgi:glucose-6-phosphate 1-dehydrogenase